MLTMPDSLRDIYPNTVRMTGDTPVAVFRDHRWTLPVMALAAEQGLLSLPVCVIGFDRHPDALMPACGAEPLAGVRREGNYSHDVFVPVVRDRLSPRDDDWVRAGMELGIVGDMASFGSIPDDERDENVGDATIHCDTDGAEHRLYRLGRPHHELSFKGAFADGDHPTVRAGMWERLGWNRAGHAFTPPSGPYVLDLDLDYWTISWDTYTFPFPPDVFAGEFGADCQSPGTDPYPVKNFFDRLVAGAVLVTIATEPGFCGGADHAQTILEQVDRYLFDGRLDAGNLRIDYRPVYPDE